MTTTATSAPPRAQPRKKRRWLRLALLLVFGCALAIVVAEVSLRVLRATLRPAVYELDDRLGWRLTRSVDRQLKDEHGRQLRLVTDAQGCRIAPDAAAGAPPRQGGVLFVGDSFLMGAQVQHDELFATLVADGLGDVPCTNAGVGGWSTVQQLLALDELLPLRAPRLVVLAVYENDFVDNLMPYFSGLGPRPHARIRDTVVQLVPEPDPGPFLRFVPSAPAALWLYRNSAIYQSVHKNLFLPANDAELRALEHGERDAVPQPTREAAMHWTLQRMQARVREAGARLAVCLLPTRDMAAGDEPAASHGWLAACCDELGLPFLSLLDALRDGGGADNYFPVDIHFNAAGHATTAGALLPFVRELLR